MSPDYALLGLLARKPASGYDLSKWLATNGLFMGRSLSMSPVYRALSDLHERGWITFREEGRDNAPSAKVYSLTPAGREALIAWAESPYQPALRPMAPDFITRLSFAGQLGPEIALQIVQTELDFRRHQREAEAGPNPGMRDMDAIPEIDPAWLTELDFITHARGWQSTSWYISWLESISVYLAGKIKDQSTLEGECRGN